MSVSSLWKFKARVRALGWTLLKTHLWAEDNHLPSYPQTAGRGWESFLGVFFFPVYFWDCNLVTSFPLLFLPSKFSQIPLSPLTLWPFSPNNYYLLACICVYICILNYNPLSPYNVTHMFAFKGKHLALDTSWCVFPGEDHLSHSQF